MQLKLGCAIKRICDVITTIVNFEFVAKDTEKGENSVCGNACLLCSSLQICD